MRKNKAVNTTLNYILADGFYVFVGMGPDRLNEEEYIYQQTKQHRNSKKKINSTFC
jgi:hypothetical protein